MIRQRTGRSRSHPVKGYDYASLSLDLIPRYIQHARPESGNPGQEWDVPPYQVGAKYGMTLRTIAEDAHKADQPNPGICHKLSAMFI